MPEYTTRGPLLPRRRGKSGAIRDRFGNLSNRRQTNALQQLIGSDVAGAMPWGFEGRRHRRTAGRQFAGLPVEVPGEAELGEEPLGIEKIQEEVHPRDIPS